MMLMRMAQETSHGAERSGCNIDTLVSRVSLGPDRVESATGIYLVCFLFTHQLR